MATRGEQDVAKDGMEAADMALREYTEKSPDVDAGPTLYRRLTEELRKAEDEFLETMD